MSIRLTQILARLERTVDTVVQAMKPYKPKTPAQLRLKTDPAHRLMRDAYKRRTSTDKSKDHKYDKTYYQRNKSQIKQRQKRSSQIHKHPTAN